MKAAMHSPMHPFERIVADGSDPIYCCLPHRGYRQPVPAAPLRSKRPVSVVDPGTFHWQRTSNELGQPIDPVVQFRGSFVQPPIVALFPPIVSPIVSARSNQALHCVGVAATIHPPTSSRTFSVNSNFSSCNCSTARCRTACCSWCMQLEYHTKAKVMLEPTAPYLNGNRSTSCPLLPIRQLIQPFFVSLNFIFSCLHLQLRFFNSSLELLFLRCGLYIPQLMYFAENCRKKRLAIGGSSERSSAKAMVSGGDSAMPGAQPLTDNSSLYTVGAAGPAAFYNNASSSVRAMQRHLVDDPSYLIILGFKGGQLTLGIFIVPQPFRAFHEMRANMGLQGLGKCGFTAVLGGLKIDVLNFTPEFVHL